MNPFSAIWRFSLDFLFPKSRRTVRLEALTARDMLDHLPSSSLSEGDTLALFDYQDDVVKALVWEVKYGGSREVSRKLGESLYDFLTEELIERQIFEKFSHPILAPVPVSGKRLFERGWNQSELLTAAVMRCDTSGELEHLPNALERFKHTESQTKTRSKKERLQNIQGSMRVRDPSVVKDRCVVVVDDVTTTGATFAEACRALKEAGARKILCLAVAH